MTTGANKYCVPGGFMDRDETTAQTALRELKEETGYEGKIISLFRIKDNPDRIREDRQNVDFIYLVELGTQTGSLDHETAKIEWFNLDNLPESEEWAFDHLSDFELYKEYLKNPFPLPFVNGLNK